MQTALLPAETTWDEPWRISYPPIYPSALDFVCSLKCRAPRISFPCNCFLSCRVLGCLFCLFQVCSIFVDPLLRRVPAPPWRCHLVSSKSHTEWFRGSLFLKQEGKIKSRRNGNSIPTAHILLRNPLCWVGIISTQEMHKGIFSLPSTPKPLTLSPIARTSCSNAYFLGHTQRSAQQQQQRARLFYMQ